MATKPMRARCPFRDGSASKTIYMALARSKTPLTPMEIRRRTKLPEAKVKTLLAAYTNPMHLAPLLRAGVALERVDGAFRLATCTPKPNANRPERGKKVRTARRKKPARRKPTGQKNVVEVLAAPSAAAAHAEIDSPKP